MEGINSFEKGLHRTNSPQEQPEGSYVDALNWIRNDSGRLINEEMEVELDKLPGYTLVGYTPINDEFICFFQVAGGFSEIGTFSKTIGYTPAFNDINHTYKLNFGSSIDCVARIISLATDPTSSGDLVVYFVEKGNTMRRFNISQYVKLHPTDPSVYNTIEDFNLLLKFSMPYCNLNIIESGGALDSGVYSIVLRYRTSENNKTICNIPTKFISIIDENPADLPSFSWTGKYSDFFDGCPPGTSTTKSISITLKHVDENYPYVEPIIITYTGIANNLVIKSLGVYDNVEDSEILFSSLDQLKDAVPTTEITENALFYDSAECIEQKDNVLVLSNLTTKKYDDIFQQVANDIDLYWEIETYTISSPRFINSEKKNVNPPSADWEYTSGSAGNLPHGEIYNTVVDSTDYWNTNIYQNPTVKKGFQRGEVYSFSITPIYKDGSVGFAYHIPGKKKDPNYYRRLVNWESIESYPNYMDKYDINGNGQNLIWHHQMPDFDETGKLGGHNFDTFNVYTNSTINVLRVKAKNINLSKYNLKNSVQGYIIGYQQRNNDTNTRIIDYGFIRPYLKLDGVNQYRNSMFNGSALYRTQNFSWQSTGAVSANSPYAMYHSADTTYLGREIKESYSLQKIGYAINAVPNYNTNVGIGIKKYDISNLVVRVIDSNEVYLDGAKSPGDPTIPFNSQNWLWKVEYLNSEPGIFNNDISTFINTNTGYNKSYGLDALLNYSGVIPINGTTYKYIRISVYMKNGIFNYSFIDLQTIPILTFGSNDIMVAVTNEYQNLYYKNSSTPLYNNSGTDVIVYEGTAKLDYDGVGTSNGTWTISSVTATKITLPTQSAVLDDESGKNFARYGDFSNITSASGTINKIIINITGKKTDGTVFTTQKAISRTKINLGTNNSYYNDYFPGNGGQGYNIVLTRRDATVFTDTNAITYYDGTTAATVAQSYRSRLPLLLFKTDTSLGNAAGMFFYEEGDFQWLPNQLERIEATELVSNVYNDRGITKIGTNITLNQCNSFWHIKIASNRGIIQDGDPDFNWFREYQIRYDQREGDGGADDVFQISPTKKITLAISRIVNPIGFQYGSLSFAEYAPILTRLDDQNLDVLNTDSLELEGDTYVCKTFMRRYDDFRSRGNNDGRNDTTEGFTAQMLIGFYCESRNNLALRYKEATGAEYYPKNRVIHSNDPNNLGTMNRPLDTITYPYNKQYSATNNIKVNVSIPTFFKEVTSFPNRSIFSYGSFETDLVDQYRIFPANQFHDIPKDRGVIKDTFVFNNNFFHHTEYGLWQSYFNPNTTQATSSGQIVLGNAGIFKLPSKIVLDIKGGYMGTFDKSGTNTPFGRVFLDHAQGKVFLFAGEAPLEISDLGLFPFFREFVNKNDAGKYALGYDWENKRLLIANRVYKENNLFSSNPINLDIVQPITTNIPYSIGVLDEDKFFEGKTVSKKVIKFTITTATKLTAYFTGGGKNVNMQITGAGEFFRFSNLTNANPSSETDLDLLPGEYYITIFNQVAQNYFLKLIFPKKEGLTISFYPKTQTWTSFHTFIPSHYLSLNRECFAYQGTSFWDLNNVIQIRKDSEITFVNNTSPDNFKRYERLEMNTSSGGANGGINPGGILDNNYSFLNNSFTTIQTWNERQNTSELPFFYSNDYLLLSDYYNDKVPVTLYKNSFHAEIPFDSVVDANGNIFDPANINLLQDFKSHMKSKFLYIKLSYKNTLPLVLNYVKTFFKPTVN